MRRLRVPFQERGLVLRIVERLEVIAFGLPMVAEFDEPTRRGAAR